MAKYKFIDSRYMTARGKELTLKNWVRFLENGLQREDLTSRLEGFLTIYCFRIRNYDYSDGFYRTYFENGENTMRFLSLFDKRKRRRAVERNSWMQGHDKDLAKAMIREAAPYLPKLMEAAQARQRKADLAEAERLAAKHGVELDLTS